MREARLLLPQPAAAMPATARTNQPASPDLQPVLDAACEGASQRVLAVLPLIYVAWADGTLTPSQMEATRERLAGVEGLSEGDRAALGAWLDPQNPPSVSTYNGWMRAISAASERIPAHERASLGDLGVAMARLAGLDVGGDGAPAWSNEATRRALEDVEHALGILPAEAARALTVGHRPSGTAGGVAPARIQQSTVQSLLDGPHRDLRDRVRALLSDPVFSQETTLPAPTHEYREQVLAWCQRLAEQGLGALAYPEEYGGGGSMERFIVAFETLAEGDLSLVIKFGVQFGLWGGSVAQLGTAKHHEKYLRQIGSLELPGCFAMSELGHGSNVRDCETTATYDAETGEFVVNTPHDRARKEWIGNAALHGRMATVFAQLRVAGEGHGVHAFLVPLRSEDGEVLPGIRIEDCGQKMGLNGVDNGRIWFDRVRVPRENLLDRFASVSEEGVYTSPIPSEGRRFFTMLSTLVGGRISVACAGLSATKVALTIALRYGAARRQFGPSGAEEVPLLTYRTHQRRLFPPLATAYGLHFALEDLRSRFAAEHARAHDGSQREGALQRIEAEANALKAYATQHATRAIQTCREACGGQGYLTENRLPGIKADTDVFTTFEGDNTVLLLQVAKGLLSDYRRAFQDLSFFGVIQHVATERIDALLDRNPLLTHRREPEHLRDAAAQLALFERREQDLLASAARRLRARIKSGMDAFDAFVDVQDHLVTLAEAHAEYLVLSGFVSALDATAEAFDEPTQSALERLRMLYALERIERHAGWYLAQGYLDEAKARAVTHEVNALCGQLRPDAVALADAFGIPDPVLAAPIALGQRA
jgi:acyl-CoA oxidase